jgi:hypothetical protein
VDLEKGLLEAIQLNLDSWSYIQQVDYEQVPFKCKIYHEYGHFAKLQGLEEKGRGNNIGPEKEKEFMELSGESSKSPHTQNMENPEISEEER